MHNRIALHGLRIDERLYALVQDEIAPGTGIETDAFWAHLADMVQTLGPRNQRLLARRHELQRRIDQWYRQQRRRSPQEQRAFLQDIGYLETAPTSGLRPAGPIATSQVDDEIARCAGPQLVVPVDNARYALNAANARWGSLYDALYGTDVIPETEGRAQDAAYNPVRGAAVIRWTERFLDKIFPWTQGSHRDVKEYRLRRAGGRWQLEGRLAAGATARLADGAQYAGHVMEGSALQALLLRHHGLHVELQFDRQHPVGRRHPAGLKDVILESAVTTIQDFEDSVAAVDAADKVRVYRNWNGLMQGTLEAVFEKAGRQVTRRLKPDRVYAAPDGTERALPGRSLLLVRHVGPHMYTDSVTTDTGQAIPEGFLDAMVASLAARHDLQGRAAFRNSRAGSIYVVKPKLHGSAEVALTVDLFAAVEHALALPPLTLKLGVMDEERRTTVNLARCIATAQQRIVFINTGFLDRTGDEIHTAMHAGAMLPKEAIRAQRWLAAYEDGNVDAGLRQGFVGRAQIGKGMWTMPDAMGAMLQTKQSHPEAGATTAWVPSPTAATLHALHYHAVDVAARQRTLADRAPADQDALLTPPLLEGELAAAAVQQELDNNAQGILGYVVRWVQQGIGCSKVPDINGIGLMEDRATLRIASQHIANWLLHGIVEAEQVRRTFARMAAVVDAQNAADPDYAPMTPHTEESQAFQAALELVFQGASLPNGYTEPVLHARRRAVKALAAANAP